MFQSEDFKRGYDAGYKRALLDAISQTKNVEPRPGTRFDPHKKIGGPDAPYRKGGLFIE